MTDRDDGQWDPPTEHDEPALRDSGDLSGEDPPTTRASDGQRARARDLAIANQLASAGASGPRPAGAASLTLPPPAPQRPPAKAAPAPALAKATPAAPALAKTPASSPGRFARPAASATSPPTVVLGAAQGTAPPTRVDDQAVVLLDRVSGNAPIDNAPRRTDATAGGIVVVATGLDADRVRKLCHKAGLLVPVMSSLAVVHDAMSVVVIGEPSPPAPERVVHVVRPTLSDDRFVDLLRALVSGRVVVEPPQPHASDTKAADAARRLGSLTDRGAIEMITIEAITALTGADRAHCLFHDPLSGALWSESRKRTGNEDRRAMGGLVGWAAQTGQTVHASPAGDDPRWLQELDDPEGKAQSRLLVQPIIGGDRRVHAVLVAVRRWRHADFGDADKRAFASFAALAGPALDLAVAASPVEPRRARSTLQGPLAAASKSALVSTPRATSDSRPPPVTARASTSPPPPIGDVTSDEKRTLRDAARPAVEDLPTKIETIDPRLAEDRPTRTEAVDPRILAESRGDRSSEPRDRLSDSILPLPMPPPVGYPAPAPGDRAAPASAAAKTPPAVSESGIWQAESGKWPDAGVAAAKRAATSPSDTFLPHLPAKHPETGPVDINKPIGVVDKRSGPVRTRPAHDSNQPRLHVEPRDVAVVASGEDAKRVQKLAKKARLEVSIVRAIEEAPAFFQVVALGGSWSRETENRVAYAARPTIPDDQLGDLLVALSTGRAVVPAPLVQRPQTAAEARRSQIAFAGARKLALVTDLVDAEAAAIATLKELLDTDRAYCLMVDPDSGALWSATRKRNAADDRRAIAGIAGWAARTGVAVSAPRASADARWLGPIDDPDGDENSQLLVQPMLRADDRVYGVLIAARRPKRPGFTDAEAVLLARFAALAAPLFEQIVVGMETHQLVGDDTAARAPMVPTIEPVWQTVLRGQHAWSRWAYLAIGAVVAFLLALIF